MVARTWSGQWQHSNTAIMTWAVAEGKFWCFKHYLLVHLRTLPYFFARSGVRASSKFDSNEHFPNSDSLCRWPPQPNAHLSPRLPTQWDREAAKVCPSSSNPKPVESESAILCIWINSLIENLVLNLYLFIKQYHYHNTRRVDMTDKMYFVLKNSNRTDKKICYLVLYVPKKIRHHRGPKTQHTLPKPIKLSRNIRMLKVRACVSSYFASPNTLEILH